MGALSKRGDLSEVCHHIFISMKKKVGCWTQIDDDNKLRIHVCLYVDRFPEGADLKTIGEKLKRVLGKALKIDESYFHISIGEVPLLIYQCSKE